MTTCARWFLIAVTMLGRPRSRRALRFQREPHDVDHLERDPKTWIVQRGETLRVPADQVLPEDRWECPGKGGSTGTPPPGHGVGSSGGFSMEVDMEGNVTAYCEPGPPGNV